MDRIDLDDFNPSIHELGSAQHAGCVQVLLFMKDVVAPRVQERTKNNPMFFALASRAILRRIVYWFETLGKLNSPTHFQAVMACSRAMFEHAVDLTLFVEQEGKSFGGLMAWQDSAKLAWAERTVRHNPGHHDAQTFIDQSGPRIRQERRARWGDERHRSRWTGGSIETDAKKADALRPNGFNDYYNEQYHMACWHVHGSGVLSLLETPEELYPYFSTRGLKDAMQFAIVACRLLLEFLNIYDDSAHEAFIEVERRILIAQHDVFVTAERRKRV